MPFQPDDTASKRRAQKAPREDIARDWQDDLSAITGEPFHRSTFWLRVHPDDVVRVVRAVVQGCRSRRIEVEYRLRDWSGAYVAVRAAVYRIPDEHGVEVWSGAVRRLVRPDCEFWPDAIRFSHEN